MSDDFGGSSNHAIDDQYQIQHRLETYKSLPAFGSAFLKGLQLLNGGAVVALLAYLGQGNSQTDLAAIVFPTLCFVVGLVFAVITYVPAYLTQHALYQESKGDRPFLRRPHGFWLWTGFITGVLSLVAFVIGAIAGVNVLAKAQPASSSSPLVPPSHVQNGTQSWPFEITMAHLALFIGFLALVVAFWQGFEARKHDRLSVRPYLFFEVRNEPGGVLGLRVTNGGLGPAIVKSFTIRVDGERQAGWPEAVTKLRKENLNFLPVFEGYSRNSLLQSGESNYMLSLPSGKRAPLLDQQLDEAVRRLRIEILYESMYRVSGRVVWTGDRGIL